MRLDSRFHSLANALAGQIGLAATLLASAARRSEMRLLAVFDLERNRAFPGMPMAIEQG